MKSIIVGWQKSRLPCQVWQWLQSYTKANCKQRTKENWRLTPRLDISTLTARTRSLKLYQWINEMCTLSQHATIVVVSISIAIVVDVILMSVSVVSGVTAVIAGMFRRNFWFWMSLLFRKKIFISLLVRHYYWLNEWMN